MSEFAGPDCLDRLLGVDEQSGLVAKVGQQPFSVVLLDEIEKAHSAVFDLLLQVLGEARLTDRGGRMADFRNTVILMTSNLGVNTFRRPSGFGTDVRTALHDHLRGEVQRFFRPELVGRLDEIVAFEPLGAEAIRRITDRELAKVRRRQGFHGREIGLDLADDVPDWLAERGVDLRYGARPLKRTLEHHLIAPIARTLSGRSHAPRSLRVSTGKASLRVRPSEDPSDQAARDEALAPALGTLGDLRFALRRWSEVRAFRQAFHQVRLVDRLSATRIFWRDEEAARTRLAVVEDARQLVEAHAKLTGEVEALEDLLLEAWAGLVPPRSDDDREALLEEADAAKAALRDLEWAIAGQGLPVRDKATVWFEIPKGSPHGVRSIEPLVLAYHALGVRMKWAMRPAFQRGSRWTEVEDELDLDGWTQFLRTPPHTRARLRLRVTGPHAATVLLPEGGVHGLDVHGEIGDVCVWVRGDHARPGYDTGDMATTRQRTVDLGRAYVRDHQLRRKRGLGRLTEVLARLVRERMLRRMLGTDAERMP